MLIYNDLTVSDPEAIKLITDNNLKLYRFTFLSDQSLSGSYIGIFAEGFNEARECMFKHYDSHWGFQYGEDQWNKNLEESKTFPRCLYGIEKPHGYFVYIDSKTKYNSIIGTVEDK